MRNRRISDSLALKPESDFRNLECYAQMPFLSINVKLFGHVAVHLLIPLPPKLLCVIPTRSEGNSSHMSFQITVQRAQKRMSTSLVLFSYFKYFMRELSGIPELSWKLQTQIIHYWNLWRYSFSVTIYESLAPVVLNSS